MRWRLLNIQKNRHTIKHAQLKNCGERFLMKWIGKATIWRRNALAQHIYMYAHSLASMSESPCKTYNLLPTKWGEWVWKNNKFSFNYGEKNVNVDVNLDFRVLNLLLREVKKKNRWFFHSFVLSWKFIITNESIFTISLHVISEKTRLKPFSFFFLTRSIRRMKIAFSLYENILQLKIDEKEKLINIKSNISNVGWRFRFIHFNFDFYCDVKIKSAVWIQRSHDICKSKWECNRKPNWTWKHWIWWTQKMRIFTNTFASQRTHLCTHTLSHIHCWQIVSLCRTKRNQCSLPCHFFLFALLSPNRFDSSRSDFWSILISTFSEQFTNFKWKNCANFFTYAFLAVFFTFQIDKIEWILFASGKWKFLFEFAKKKIVWSDLLHFHSNFRSWFWSIFLELCTMILW